MRRILLTFALSLVAVRPASAEQLKLSFNEGLVSLEATAVPVRTILVEWATLGGTKVIGGERITGSPLTLKLENVPEARALEIVLRSVAGYLAAPRSATATPGASVYDRILVLATSAAPAPAAAATRPAPNQAPGANNRFAPLRQPVRQVENDVEPDEEVDPNPPDAPVFTFPQPGQQNGAQPGMFQNPGANVQPPFITNQNTGAPQNSTINPAPPGTAPSFGAPAPGMIVAPLPGQQPQQPVVMVRPPGGH